MTAAPPRRGAPQVFVASRPATLDPLVDRLSAELAQRGVRLVDPRSVSEMPCSLGERLTALAGSELIVVLVVESFGPKAADGRTLVEAEQTEARRLGIDPLVVRLVDESAMDSSAFGMLARIDPSRIIAPPQGAPPLSTRPIDRLAATIAAEICLAVLAEPCPPGALSGVESPGAARASIQRLLDEVEMLGAQRAGAHGVGPRAGELEEQFGWAMEALRVGRTDVARRHLTQAVELRPLDWASSYSLAALIAAAPTPDWSRAREHVDNALDGTDASAAGMGARRRQATLLLAGRIAARRGETAQAATRLDDALEMPWYSRLATTERLLVAAAGADAAGALEPVRRLARTDLGYLLAILDALRLESLRPEIDRALIAMLPPLDTRIAAELENPEPNFVTAIAALTAAFDAHRSFGRDLVVRARSVCADLGRVLSDDGTLRYASVERADRAEQQITAALHTAQARCAEIEEQLLGDSGSVDVAIRLAARRDELRGHLTAHRRTSRRLRRVSGVVGDARGVLAGSVGAARISTIVRIVAAALAVLVVLRFGGSVRLVVGLALVAVAAFPLFASRGAIGLAETLCRRPLGAAEDHEAVLAGQLALVEEWDTTRTRERICLARSNEVRQALATAQRALPAGDLTVEARIRRLVATKDLYAPWAAAVVGPAYSPMSHARPGDLTRVRSSRGVAEPTEVLGGINPSVDAPGIVIDRLVRCVGRGPGSTTDQPVLVSDLALYATTDEVERFVEFERWLERGDW